MQAKIPSPKTILNGFLHVTVKVRNSYVETYTFQDKIKVNIYDDLWIYFKELGILCSASGERVPYSVSASLSKPL